MHILICDYVLGENGTSAVNWWTFESHLMCAFKEKKQQQLNNETDVVLTTLTQNYKMNICEITSNVWLNVLSMDL